ncbi:hypothetical protein J3L18_00060 [Mucilaginibacter gossypii]|uniref:hypothetical protein n=1 Tax=Mucilaginibacter gossypii TaxID=551996 RepID=UPI000DCE1A4E|nr:MULTISPECIES: hypothetical protein [Mucilaginibacter]QTE37496.1 hypothetical protein J3L18_00060 [Mucilaginibacter gossypii]RAV52321.1 hypothetical protein DIU36_24615 [Mucilaginibacter rubeus]
MLTVKLGLEKERSCDGKDQYESKAEASQAAARLCMKGNTRIEMVGYQCIFCSKFHIGHASMVKTIKNPNKLKVEKVNLDYKQYAGAHPRLKTGYCIIRQFYF